MSLIFTDAEVVFIVGETVDHWRLDPSACAILSRMVHRRREWSVVVPDRTVSPFTHMVIMGQAMFRVRAEELTPEEADSVGLFRRVSVEEVAQAGLERPLRPVPVSLGLTPGDGLQEAMDRGLPGWKWRG